LRLSCAGLGPSQRYLNYALSVVTARALRGRKLGLKLSRC